MTTILTPVDELKEGMELSLFGTTGRIVYIRATSSAMRVELDVNGYAFPCMFYAGDFRNLFPDGVPVIVPDKPKEVRCVVTVDEDGTPRVDGEICVSVGDWLDILLENSKTYDLVLTDREDSK